ncbi:diguanylate cyclase [Thermovibrio ammonificans HB-1]|uniref:diguanylate cyclase n=1 Tax=Thermovibrio ammonificans (strain DSM 15698 / JCM 12110 / HB-1) TaxID=648996 RepID=E8T6D2_THEA1|nr:GGDEF domain-containing protein [Thermovibrio ammonificans]ADU96716.1 diguanylate cyclase [Thermovibrio ammonificans HB-1]
MQSLKLYVIKRVVFVIVMSLSIIFIFQYFMIERAKELHLKNLQHLTLLLERNFSILMDLYSSPALIRYNIQKLREEVPGLTAVYIRYGKHVYFYPQKGGERVGDICNAYKSGVFEDNGTVVVCVPIKSEYASEFVVFESSPSGVFGVAFDEKVQDSYLVPWEAGTVVVSVFLIILGGLVVFTSWSEVMQNFKAMFRFVKKMEQIVERISRNSNPEKVKIQKEKLLKYARGITIKEFKQIVSLIAYLVEKLHEFAKKASNLAMKDPLTGLFNRNYLRVFVEGKLLALWHRHRFPFSVAMIDLDNFKRINDTYGHGKGDEVLKGLAKLLQGTLRGSDIAVRFGGEEILVVMPYTDKESAKKALERVRKLFKELDFEISQPVTFSAGIASFPDDVESVIPLERLIKIADERLYRAKKMGKDRIVID